MCLNHILYNKGLLQYGAIENLTLDCQLGLESTRVRLCPNEASINKLDLHTSSNAILNACKVGKQQSTLATIA